MVHERRRDWKASVRKLHGDHMHSLALFLRESVAAPSDWTLNRMFLAEIRELTSTFEWRVWSLPERTWMPGCHLWPLCLAKMSPSKISSVWPHFLSPSLRPAESFLLLVEPPIIFVAKPIFYQGQISCCTCISFAFWIALCNIFTRYVCGRQFIL